MNNEQEILEGQIRECFGRLVYTHKTHEKCADILFSYHKRIKFSQVLLSALTTAGVVSVMLGTGDMGAAISVVLSAILLVLNSYTKDYDFGEVAQKHRSTGSGLWLIREAYISLLADIRVGDQSIENIRKRRDDLMNRAHAIYEGAPSTTSKAYREAQKALQKDEDMTFTDQEIDNFLPTNIKRTAKRPAPPAG